MTRCTVAVIVMSLVLEWISELNSEAELWLKLSNGTEILPWKSRRPFWTRHSRIQNSRKVDQPHPPAPPIGRGTRRGGEEERGGGDTLTQSRSREFKDVLESFSATGVTALAGDAIILRRLLCGLEVAKQPLKGEQKISVKEGKWAGIWKELIN